MCEPMALASCLPLSPSGDRSAAEAHLIIDDHSDMRGKKQPTGTFPYPGGAPPLILFQVKWVASSRTLGPHCLNPNPQWWNRTPAATAPRSQRPRSGSFGFRDRLPPPGGAMENDSIEGDKWDAYVTLDTFSTNGTRD